MFVDGVLRASWIGVRNPDRREAKVVCKDVVRQRSTEVRQERHIFSGRASERFNHPAYPRVIGIEALSVVDASIMPTIVRGNTNIPVIMLAERACDLLAGADRGERAASASLVAEQ